MTGLLAKPAALVLASLLLVAGGAGLGVWLAAGHYRPQIDRASQYLVACCAARGNLEALAQEQGAKLGDLTNQAQQRQAKAAQAVADAQQQAGQHFAAAQRLQQEHIAGDPAQVAVELIDKELWL
ncbi:MULTISPECIES: hypothetical protein [unclassified Pseudomonas]|jgi:hypothetical protein|uniref:hypothetical protein n=1 Tax=unclassified Pseudomonas TaxID=196821 RepID=UPI0007309558|nr:MULTISPECIES: hypothetical protein [unclassified Pseudomonas]KSW23994.1 hypothetical protein AOX63_09570 [Pseudomonas sp. ADP]OBP11723.1 hypothetical protein BAE52_06485 [Pseudomonas sp. EGD-AKN5]QOF86520.1 hypothetical protein IG194_07520 [Pseudomonas sp. ADPe]